VTAEAFSIGQAVMLRSGVVLPDWTVVGSPAARAALDAAFDAFDMNRKLSGFGASEECVWRTVLRLYAHGGKAPTTDQIEDASSMAPDRIADLLRRLAARDLIVLNLAGQVVGAYPFTDRETEHRLHTAHTVVGAMCAIDALGIGAMLGVDTAIHSSCRYCRQGIEIATSDGGTTLAEFSPEHVVVWSGSYCDGCAADSLCTVQAFFCSERHLQTWRSAAKYGADGVLLTLDEALQVGRAIFEPILK
jgi:alkylmercury lyase